MWDQRGHQTLTGLCILTALLGSGLLSSCASTGASAPSRPFSDIAFATWSNQEPAYVFFPGDELEIALLGAPELNRTVKVGPDGRISMPYVGGVMAAYRSEIQLAQDLRSAYETQIRRPEVEVHLKAAAPMKVIVAGEVNTPGFVEMAGDLDALQAVMAAGGLKPTAKVQQIVLIRRSSEGRPMRRILNLSAVLNGNRNGELVALKRYDVIYVPRSSIAEADLFMQQYVRELIPVGLSYNINNPWK